MQLCLQEGRKVWFPNWGKRQERGVQPSSHVLVPPELTDCEWTAAGLLPGEWSGGLGLGFCISVLFLAKDLIPQGTCLSRITCISGMSDLSRWLCGGSMPVPGQASILALSAVTLAAFNVCSSPSKYCLGSKFGQLWDYFTICNLYALLSCWLACWLRGSFSSPAVPPPMSTCSWWHRSALLIWL